MQKENLINLGLHSIYEFAAAYNKYPEEVMGQYQMVFNHPRFRTRETGVSRRDISVWKKEGLFPSSDTIDTTWNEFSLIECIWLRLVSRLKKFGCDNNFILEFKEMVFSQKAKDYRNAFSLGLTHLADNDDLENMYQKAQLRIEQMSDDALEKGLKEANYSLFGTILIPTCLFKMNMVIYFFDNSISFAIMEIPQNKTHEENIANILRQLSASSYFAINLKVLCSDFFENEHLVIDNDYYWAIMNLGERKVLNEIRSSKVKQVTINIKDGSITHIKPMREDKENADMIRKLSRLMKKGEYKQIELITRDGDIIKYEETDIIKMK
jgi:hypothetical protein